MTRIPDFHEEMDRFQNHIPAWVSRNLNRLRGERALWVRVPASVALIGGGVLGFLPLPIVGIWMLPVGLALLAHDVPTMRRPIARLLHFTNRKIEKRRTRASPATGDESIGIRTDAPSERPHATHTDD